MLLAAYFVSLTTAYPVCICRSSHPPALLFTAATSIGCIVGARLLCSFGCGAVMVFDIDTSAYPKSKNLASPLPPLGVGVHHPP